MNKDEVRKILGDVESEPAEHMREVEGEWRKVVDAINKKLQYPAVGPRVERERRFPWEWCADGVGLEAWDLLTPTQQNLIATFVFAEWFDNRGKEQKI